MHLPENLAINAKNTAYVVRFLSPKPVKITTELFKKEGVMPFQTTDHHALFWAWDLTKASSEDNFSKIAGSMMGAQVDLNPHQIDAALFALKSPLSKGALLADEVGLGKTIEAGIILAQKWAEHKRRILLVLPATLRKQWSTELFEKFYLPSVILEAKSFKEQTAQGIRNPFDRTDVLILTSYQFAARNAPLLKQVAWDLVVIDEAHRVRNSWQKSNIMGRTLKEALIHTKKILLTATPLQNSTMELFGLLSFIDPHAFGSEDSFRTQYARLAGEGRFDDLRARIAPFFHRTLRRQVLEYIRYTKRIALTETYTPGDEEQSFYDDFSAWLQKPHLYALPKGQRALIVLVLHKLLASSTFALESVLDRMLDRVRQKRQDLLSEDLAQEVDDDGSLADDWDEAADVEPDYGDEEGLEEEILTLESFQSRVKSIGQNAKGNKLLTALETGFREMANRGAAKKAIIFTESRRTQKYLLDILQGTPYGTSVVLFNGDNKDASSKEIYQDWLRQHQSSDRVTGSPTADMRSALVDKFKNSAQVMIATEAAAEGVNLQFCSLVINYDLPWNPQRIEQRIGRCHRYGQKHDVVVINFLNTRNQADKRVYELLQEKLKLFDGVFGASDDVLGALGSGVDFERRILGIYQKCRTKTEIDDAFGQLQLDLEEVINTRMAQANQKVMENLDEEVHSRLKLMDTEVQSYRSSQERSLYYLTKHFKANDGTWDDGRFHFTLGGEKYQFNPTVDTLAHNYRLQHPLAQEVLQRAKALTCPVAEITFTYTGSPVISALEDYIGNQGWMQVELLVQESPSAKEETLLVVARTDDGRIIPSEVAKKLFLLGGTSQALSLEPPQELSDLMNQERQKCRLQSQERNQKYFTTEIDKLDGWADDLKSGLELRIKELEQQIKETKKASALSVSLEEKVAHQRTVKDLESERNQQRRRLFDAQDEIDAKRDEIIGEIEGRIRTLEDVRGLFRLRWKLR
jgi:adenine-specific DNA-methyltransferase